MTKVEHQRELRASNRAFAREYLGGKCAECGFNGRLDFDHTDPASKHIEISRLFSSARATLLLELSKCQLLCRRCHIAKTKRDNGQPPEPLHGTITRAINYRCKCDLCRSTRNRVMNEYRWRTGTRRRRVTTPIQHGERRSYRKGCRCETCTTAQREYQRGWTIRRKHGLVAEQG